MNHRLSVACKIIALLTCSAASLLFAREEATVLVDLSRVNNNIRLEIRYATRNNCLGEQIYNAPKCYVRLEVAQALNAIQQELEKHGYGLKVFDGYQPPSARNAMWNLLPDANYMVNPTLGDSHARGMGVDVTIVTKDGTELSMPTQFDSMTTRALRSFNDLPEHIKHNRKMLTDIMVGFGFEPGEDWWHFDYKGWQDMPVLHFEFHELQ